jgi:cytochrome c oxidase assembly protein subunit 15
MTTRFRRLLTGTSVLTFLLILLGVYTGAIGAGLTCGARWPLCDGWMGLFPANWASFVEWFHRLVAMVTGFAILGSTIAAWRGDYSSRIKYATAIATVVLPVQILLGANTIINFGAAAQVLHHAAALTILVALVAASAWSFDGTATAAAADSPADAGTDAATSSD